MPKENSISDALQARINEKIATIDKIADDLPGVVIIHNIRTQCVEYMSPRGLRELKSTLEKIKALGKEYNTKYFNPEDAKDYVPKLFDVIEKNDFEKIISFFQQVRASENHDFIWHFSAMKLLLKDEEGKPLLTITMAHPVDPEAHITSKVSRLLEENNFLKKHHHEFNELTVREQEVLKFTVLGYSAAETSKMLFISQNTVETHRRNIKKKLKAESLYQLSQYARAFDLI